MWFFACLMVSPGASGRSAPERNGFKSVVQREVVPWQKNCAWVAALADRATKFARRHPCRRSSPQLGAMASALLALSKLLPSAMKLSTKSCAEMLVDNRPISCTSKNFGKPAMFTPASTRGQVTFEGPQVCYVVPRAPSGVLYRALNTSAPRVIVLGKLRPIAMPLT